MDARRWDLTFSNDTENVRLENVTPETRPTLHIEEELRIEDGKEVWYPMKDANGKIISQWQPLIIGNIGGVPAFPAQPLVACMELTDDDGIAERWTFKEVKPQRLGQHLQIEFAECTYERRGVNL